MRCNQHHNHQFLFLSAGREAGTDAWMYTAAHLVGLTTTPMSTGCTDTCSLNTDPISPAPYCVAGKREVRQSQRPRGTTGFVPKQLHLLRRGAASNERAIPEHTRLHLQHFTFTSRNGSNVDAFTPCSSIPVACSCGIMQGRKLAVPLAFQGNSTLVTKAPPACP